MCVSVWCLCFVCLCVHVCVMHTHEPWLACWGQVTTCQQKWSLFSPSVTWVLGIEFRSSGLVASTSVCWTISLACEKLLLGNMISCVLWFEYEIPLVGPYVRLFPSLGYCYFGRFFKFQDIRCSRGRELLEERGEFLALCSCLPGGRKHLYLRHTYTTVVSLPKCVRPHDHEQGK